MRALTKSLRLNFSSVRTFMTNVQSVLRVQNYVVFDCDGGADDAWGLLTLAKFEESFSNIEPKSPSPEVEVGREAFTVLGVTCVQGKTDVYNVVKNTFRVLESVDRLDIPVYKGCANPILPRSSGQSDFRHVKDGFGDVPDLPDVTKAKIQPEPAAVQMYNFVCQYPKKVDFLLVGPLTNFATCITMFGDDFLSKVRSVWIGGGNIADKECAEFNFNKDPEAAYIVLKSLKSNTILVPFETCADKNMNPDINWRFNVLGKVNTKAMKLMNAVDRAVPLYKNIQKWMICDASLVASYCFPNLLIENCNAFNSSIDLKSTNKRLILDDGRNDPNTCIVSKINAENYKNILSWVGGAMDDRKFRDLMRMK